MNRFLLRLTLRSGPVSPALAFALMLPVLQAATPDEAADMMRRFLQREAVRLDAAFLDGATNREEWEDRRERLRREYLDMLGLWPLPERTPLRAQVTGVLERDEGFRVEKIHFQSRPQLYVTANLYLPKDAKAGDQLPAVLYLCGHSNQGRDGNKAAYQHHGAWFATHGYACLVVDTLQLGEIAAIHHGTYRYQRWWWQARGYTPAGVECWNGIRALDYLQSRPEVDPSRLAVTGRSGGGAATFWITAADDRVQVAVPVSGMGDLEDYVGEKVVNGHCDCMFFINTYQWSWAQIAALIAPRPMLFENSGHDPIFPMNGNDRIRARLEHLYGFYTNRTGGLFDIGVVPGGHEDGPELRAMACRWINRFLKGDNTPVTEPVLPRIDGRLLRVFPDGLPADEINTRVDELFVPTARRPEPRTRGEFESARSAALAELRRRVFRSVPDSFPAENRLVVAGQAPSSGTVTSEPGVTIPWKFIPASASPANASPWLVVLDENESIDERPAWFVQAVGDQPVLLVAPRGSGPLRLDDPPPFYLRRSLALLGRTLDTCRLIDVLAAAAAWPATDPARPLKIAGHGQVGVIAAYAALLDERIVEVTVFDPPVSHRIGPIFLNVLQILDIPEVLGMLAPRPLSIFSHEADSFASVRNGYQLAGGRLSMKSVPPE